MHFGNLLQSAFKLFAAPREYWRQIAAEPDDLNRQLFPRVLVLAAIPAFSYFLGGVVGGISSLGFGARLASGIIGLLVSYPLNIVLWVILAYLIDIFAPTFGATRNITRSMKLGTGAMTPVWVGSVLHITGIPGIGWLGILGGLTFGAYVLQIGLCELSDAPKEKSMSYAAASVGVLFAGMVLISLPLSCASWVTTTSLAPH